MFVTQAFALQLMLPNKLPSCLVLVGKHTSIYIYMCVCAPEGRNAFAFAAVAFGCRPGAWSYECVKDTRHRTDDVSAQICRRFPFFFFFLVFVRLCWKAVDVGSRALPKN